MSQGWASWYAMVRTERFGLIWAAGHSSVNLLNVTMFKVACAEISGKTRCNLRSAKVPR
jgi:hypothetical protein